MFGYILNEESFLRFYNQYKEFSFKDECSFNEYLLYMVGIPSDHMKHHYLKFEVEYTDVKFSLERRDWFVEKNYIDLEKKHEHI